jgi:hypothetical protein
MPEREAWRNIGKDIAGVAKGSPAIAAGEGIAKVGGKIIDSTPRKVRSAVRKGARLAGKYARKVRSRVGSAVRNARHRRYRR